jgi:3-hydroxyisobutyrate dehydrogenase
MNKPRIGLIGTGLMGLAMAQRLLDNNWYLTVYNRTTEKLTPLVDSKIVIAKSVEEVINDSESIILMLTDKNAIAEVLFSNYQSPNLINKIIIQMGTIAPKESKEVSKMIIDIGGEYLEAPVLGSIPEAKTGELIVMVGGEKALFDRSLELLKNFSKEPQYIGMIGNAAALKLALNQLIAGLTSSFALSLAAIAKSGVDIEQFMGILRGSALYAPTFDKKLSRMIDRNYDNPNFPTKHLLKDTDLFLDMAAELDLDSSSLIGIRKIITKLIELGLAEGDYSAIFEAIEVRSL